MDTIKAIEERRSIRKFQNKIVPKETIERLLELATKAPSGKIVSHGDLSFFKIVRKMS